MWKLLKRWRSALPLLLAGLLALFVIKATGRTRILWERGAGQMGSWVAGLPTEATRSIREASNRIQGLWDAETRARDLEVQLELMNLEYRQLEESYQRALKRGHSLEIKGRYLTHLIPTSLLARDPGSWFRVILLDKGSNDGVVAGQGVMSPLGVVGRILSVQADDCKAIFITDSSCRLSVRDGRSRVLAILAGDGRKACHLEYASGQDDIQVGDVIETAPGSLSFPSGIPAGTVTRVQRVDNGLKLDVDVQPCAEINRLEGLFIAGSKGDE